MANTNLDHPQVLFLIKIWQTTNDVPHPMIHYIVKLKLKVHSANLEHPVSSWKSSGINTLHTDKIVLFLKILIISNISKPIQGIFVLI